MNENESGPRIVVAGASGYIGRAIIPLLLQKFPKASITALSRSHQVSDDPRIEWKPCELFSLKSLEQALPHELDLAIYLVHSMGPTAHLDQGSFADYDLILADNFARTVKKTKVRQVIYLAGLIPETEKLSLHLQSRLEVEQVFREHLLPCTIFRAGLILGEEGSSSQILLKLVKRLPVMLCPSWTQTATTPVDLQTVLSALSSAALDPQHFNRVYDLAGCEPLSYLQMMRDTARKLGLRRYFFKVPVFTPTLSRLWVSLITNTPKQLVYPLVQSLEHPMVARKEFLFHAQAFSRTYYQLLENISLRTRPKKALFHFRPAGRTVRSVQRLVLPSGKDAIWVKEKYLNWLPRFLLPFIRIRQTADGISFSPPLVPLELLQLKVSETRSNPDRQLLYIVKGKLVRGENRGRLEFRVVLNRKYVLAAIHDYTPSLPWFIYQFTQAKLHLWVMRNFARFLKKNAAPENL